MVAVNRWQWFSARRTVSPAVGVGQGVVVMNGGDHEAVGELGNVTAAIAELGRGSENKKARS
jgi:3-dehydroquinate synthase class II